MSNAAAARELELERYETTVAAIYRAAMLGLPEEDCRLLCAETGVQWRDVEGYVPPLLRRQQQVQSRLAL